MKTLTKKKDKALIRDLGEMILLNGSEAIAAEVAEAAEVVEFEKGSILFEEGDDDHDIYFVLNGRLQLSVDDREFAVIGQGAHVGEIALIDPNAERSATVRALEHSVTAKLSAEAFGRIAERHEPLWRRLSQVLGNHLRWTNQFLERSNACPRVLICASEIGLPFALAMKSQAADRSEAPDWAVESVCFEEGDSLQALQGRISKADFGVLVLAPGDLDLVPDGDELVQKTLLQCGLCFGALGPERTLIVQPSDLGDGSPAALLGLTSTTYRLDPHEALRADIESISARIQSTIRELGVR